MSPKRPRVLTLVPRMPHPAVSGGEVRVSSLMRALSDRFEFHLMTFLERGVELEQTAAAVELQRREGVEVLFCRRTPGLAPDPGKPGIAASYWDPAMAALLRQAIPARRVDVVLLEFTQMTQYAEHAADLAPVVSTEHDASVLSPTLSYLRDGETGDEAARKARSYLTACFERCRRVVALSEADAERLRPLAGAEKLRVVPTGTDVERFAFKPLKGRDAARALFIGHYPHYPNEDAAVFLCREVLPRLKSLRPDARVELAGSAPTPAVRALASPDVQVTGTLPDVAPRLWSAGVFIAPMRRGFGIKGKVLEAFSAGLPVVATPQACEAMPGLRDGREVLLGRDAGELACAAARVMGDPRLAARLASAARRYVVARFDWKRQARLLASVLEEAAGA